jgi:ribosomal protein S18 acetylase RimI-like enzyme
MEEREIQVRRAEAGEATAIARLLDEFNREFDEPTPGVEALAENLRRLFASTDLAVLLAGEGPDAVAVLRFRGSIWDGGLEAHLQELYVVPALRGRGIGRRVLDAAIELAREAGATNIDLNTGATDTAARNLYESVGFTNREGGPEGPAMLFYEREI